MWSWLTILLRSLAVAIPIVAGVVSVMWSASFKAAAEVRESVPRTVAVRVITLSPVELLPRIKGYGVVGPAREWRAVARVEGEVVETSPLLANGQLVTEGTTLLRIDDTDLQLSLAQLDAQLAALDVRDETLKASLELSQADLDISKVELQRQVDLRKQGIATQAALDQATRQELAARLKLTDIHNQLALNDAERNVMLTQRASAERAMQFTEVSAPFDVRIGDVLADTGQFVTRGMTLFTADGTEAADVSAQFRIGELGPLVRALEPGGTVLDLAATVRLSQAGHEVEWDATVDRVGEAIDARTQSTQVIVRIEQPQAQAVPGRRPPLRRDMFVEVELSAPLRKGIVVPSTAIREGMALTIDADGTLQKQAVTVDYSFQGISLVSEGLQVGDQLVVTDPAVAVVGMSVKALEDKALMSSIVESAKGENSGR